MFLHQKADTEGKVRQWFKTLQALLASDPECVLLLRTSRPTGATTPPREHSAVSHGTFRVRQLTLDAQSKSIGFMADFLGEDLPVVLKGRIGIAKVKGTDRILLMSEQYAVDASVAFFLFPKVAGPEWEEACNSQKKTEWGHLAFVNEADLASVEATFARKEVS